MKGLSRNHPRLWLEFYLIFMAKFMWQPFCGPKHAAIVQIVSTVQKLISQLLCQQSTTTTFRSYSSSTLTGTFVGVHQKRLVWDTGQTQQSKFHLPLRVASHWGFLYFSGKSTDGIHWNRWLISIWLRKSNLSTYADFVRHSLTPRHLFAFLKNHQLSAPTSGA